MLHAGYALPGRWYNANRRDQSFSTEWNGIENEEAITMGMTKYLGYPRDNSHEAKLIHKNQPSVIQYWNGMSQFPLLREIALTVFSASCSSADADSNFSVYKIVDAQARRNHLQAASVEKSCSWFSTLGTLTTPT